MAKKKFNPFVLLYVISGILLIISIAPIADTARDIYTFPWYCIYHVPYRLLELLIL